MSYSDPEKRRAYQREYYHKKLAPGGDKHEQYLAYQREYYREKLAPRGEKHEQTRQRYRNYHREKLAQGGDKHEKYLAYQREYYREKFAPRGDKHEQYRARHREYNGTYQKQEQYKVGKRKREKEWYQHNKENILELRRQKQQEIIRWYRQYKTTIKCIRCGENEPACLHLHHRNKADKKKNIAHYVFHASSLEKFLGELSKCDVLCANCHRLEHWQERAINADISLYKELEEQLSETRGWLARRGIKRRITSLRNVIWFHEYKRSLWCQSCGIDYPACLEFHHVEPSDKEIEVGNLFHQAVSIDRIKREISKCIVLCANCHAKLHWRADSGYDESDL